MNGSKRSPVITQSIFRSKNNMLTILLGPSGVGKTAIIEILVTQFNWKPLISYITREKRDNELYKKCITNEKFDTLELNDLLYSNIAQLNNRYGTLKADISTAVESGDHWILDFSVSYYQSYFSNLPHQAFIIMPENGFQLRDQLILANRTERASTCLSELEKFSPIYRDNLGIHNSIEIINKKDALNQTVSELLSKL